MLYVDGYAASNAGSYSLNLRWGGCADGQSACGVACIDTQGDRNNCGACALVCPTGQIACGDACVDSATDSANCGTCGNACSYGSSLTCVAGRCVCSASTQLCGGSCVFSIWDPRNCGSCGNACTAMQNCVDGRCTTAAPSNDRSTGAIDIAMSGTAATIVGTTVGATNNAGCQSGGDVYYRFRLTRREVVYADTFGTTFDTTLAFAPSTGVGFIAGTCIDDGLDCGSARILQSRLFRVLEPGTYYVVVGTFSSGTGPFTLHFQHLPVGGSNTQVTAFTGAQTVMGTTAGSSTINACGNGAGPENTHWFVTCPNFPATDLNANTCSGATWNTSLQHQTADTATPQCDDNGCGLQSNLGVVGPRRCEAPRAPRRRRHLRGPNGPSPCSCAGARAPRARARAARAAAITRPIRRTAAAASAGAARCSSARARAAGTSSGPARTSPSRIRRRAPASAWTRYPLRPTGRPSGPAPRRIARRTGPPRQRVPRSRISTSAPRSAGCHDASRGTRRAASCWGPAASTASGTHSQAPARP